MVEVHIQAWSTNRPFDLFSLIGGVTIAGVNKDQFNRQPQQPQQQQQQQQQQQKQPQQQQQFDLNGF